MADTRQVLCKYYMHGACKRADCKFSHDLRGPLPNLVCKFYLAGNCVFGANCRYDHIRPDWAPASHAPEPSSNPPPQHRPLVDSDADVTLVPSASGAPAWHHTEQPNDAHAGSYRKRYPERRDCAQPQAHHAASRSAQQPQQQHEVAWDEQDPWDQDCSFVADHSIQYDYTHDFDYYDEATGLWQAVDGLMLQEQEQEQPHANPQAANSTGRQAHPALEQCQICKRFVLNPADDEEQAAHIQECTARHQRVQARALSAGIECGICLEKVLSKPVSDRKFGLLNCEHAFCLKCIRSWRSNNDSGASLDEAVRTCPICRQTTHFVTPSTVWPATAEEKADIIDGYRSKLSSIDCKYFDHGDGTCPFGTSCLYRHILKDGTPWQPAMRKFATDEGDVKVMQPVRLSDFLELSSAPRVLRR